MTHPTLDLIQNRVSTNLFDSSRTLSDAEVRDLVAYATQAPSSFNFQNWRFIAVRDAAAKQKLQALAFGQPKVADAPVTFIVVGRLNPQERLAAALAESKRTGILDQATIDGWVGMANGMYANNPGLQRDEAVRSASLAAMTLILAASAKGLATGPMIGFDPAGVAREFGLGADDVPVMLLPVGHAAPGNWPRKPRFPVADVLQFA